MRTILKNQSELSIASTGFYVGGGIIASLTVTVFRNETNPLNLPTLLTAVVAFLTAAAFFVAGRRAKVRVALFMMCLSALLVLSLVTTSQFELRAMNSGLLFYTFLIYLVWFGPMWLARLFGYTWLAVYCVAMVVKFSPDVRLYVVTLTLTAVILGELVGAFKRHLETMSLTDPLCEVWNKRGFELLLERALRAMRRTGRPLSVIFFDLDGFKEINDTLGHAEGDRVLREFAAQLDANTRPQDILARLGGDEFVLMMPDIARAGAAQAASRLRSSVIGARWSFGVAELRPGESVEAFIARADQLMLAEKRSRKADGQPDPAGAPAAPVD